MSNKIFSYPMAAYNGCIFSNSCSLVVKAKDWLRYATNVREANKFVFMPQSPYLP